MDTARLIEALSDTHSYPHPVGVVEVRQTHISVVFLAGPYAYKIKKPVDLGFLDFTTLEKRRHFCEEEVRLNHRLAPTVYLGVVPIARTETGLMMDGLGEVVEWAVKMVRLPEEATLERRLLRQEVDRELMEALARKVASFHVHARTSEHIAAFGRFDVVAGNALENFQQAEHQVGVTVSQAVFQRLRTLTETTLARLRPVIEGRAERGVPRDTHGDLHLDHVYYFPERTPPADLVIIDCIEFNERFRFADPVADMAFLVMDLTYHGRRDLATAFADAYLREAEDEDDRALLPFYTAYRAAVRGKVEGLELAEKEIPEAERAAALESSRAHWLLALGELEEPSRRPFLILVGGLPGTGKSTLARALAEHAGGHIIRSDVIRKELGDPPAKRGPAFGFEAGLYDPLSTDRTYAECLRRADALLFEGERVIVDATFRQENRRQAFLNMATRRGVPAVFLFCQADPEVVYLRLKNRAGDISDADWSVYLRLAEQWEEPGAFTRQSVREIRSGSDREAALRQALEVLRELHLLNFA
jgi:aminoglycoside phosphotransferase family enzyme/predicted kinase